MSLWAFRFMLWYICILMVQPQNRFPFLWPLHIADICVVMAVGLHVASMLTEKKPLIRFGAATITGLLLFFAAFTSLYLGAFQFHSGWNPYIDILAKSVLVMILIEAMARTPERVWAVQTSMMLASLWWVKAGLRLSAAGATYAGDRLMGPAVSLIENPNGFAYMMCVLLPLYLYFFQQSPHKYARWGFLALTLAGVYIVFETGSRTGLMILVVLACFLLPKYGAGHRTALIVMGISIFFLLSITGGMNVQRFKSIPEAIKSFFSDKPVDERLLTQDEQSAYERRMKNQDTWKLIMDRPFFGAGINPNEHLYRHKYPYASGQVHCEILMAGRQMGFVGMGLYVALLSILFFFGWRIQIVTAEWWPSISDLAWTFKMQALVFMVGGAFSPLPWNAPELILVGSVSSLWGIVSKMSSEFGNAT